MRGNNTRHNSLISSPGPKLNSIISSAGPNKYPTTKPQKPIDDGDDSTVIIICAVVGCIVVLVIIFLLCFFFKRRKLSLSNRSSGNGQVISGIPVENNLENGQLNAGLETSVQGLPI